MFSPTPLTYLETTAQIHNAHIYCKRDDLIERFANVQFYEQFLYGGHGETAPELEEDIALGMKKEGIIIDPIYVGKAWRGMNSLLRTQAERFKEKNIVFWNTGGVYTFLSSMTSQNLK